MKHVRFINVRISDTSHKGYEVRGKLVQNVNDDKMRIL